MIPIEEQPYPLPDGWQWVTIKDIADVKGGKRLPKGKNLVNYKTRYPYIRVTDFFDNTIKADELKYLEEDVYNSIKRYTISSKDVYISIAGSIGKVGTIPLDLDGANLTENAAKITRLRGVNQSFLMWFLTSDFAQGQIKDLTKSTTQPKLALFRIEKISIPLPPLDEQQRIVSLLDELFADLDEAKALAQSVVDGSELRNTAILHKAFTGELSKLWRDEHGTALNDWQQCHLSELLLPMQTKRPTGKIFRYIDIDSIDNDRQSVKAPKIIATSEAPSRASRAVESGNVLFSIVRPYLKNVAFIDESLKDCIASTGFFVCKCKANLLPKFLYRFLCFDGTISYLTQFMKGDNSPAIRQNEFLDTPINLPPPEEQKEIVRLLDDLLYREQRTKDHTLKTLDRVELMKKSILARAFRGELSINQIIRGRTTH